MEEDYIHDLRKRKKAEEGDIETLENYKNRLLREINTLRNQKDQSVNTLRTFTVQEMQISSDKIRESRQHLEDEIKRNREAIKIFNRRAEELVERERDTAEVEIALRVDEEDLEKVKQEVHNDRREANRMIWGAKELVRLAEESSLLTKQKKERAKKLLRDAEKKLREVALYETDRRRVIVEKESLIDRKFKDMQVKEELLDNRLAWVKDKEKWIQSEYASLLHAKQYIDGRSN